jgi:hypothetical protein
LEGESQPYPMPDLAGNRPDMEPSFVIGLSIAGRIRRRWLEQVLFGGLEAGCRDGLVFVKCAT